MYALARILLCFSVLLGIYSLVGMALLGWEPALVSFVVAVLLFVPRRRSTPATILGSARWAEETDLAGAGMLEGPTGLILGRVPLRGDLRRALASVLPSRLSSRQACHQFWTHIRRQRWELVRAAPAIHTSVFAPTGSGKGVSLITPFLMECPESCVVVDHKGEIAGLTAEHRRKRLGHRIVLLDPYHVVTDQPATWNPLDHIAAGHPLSIDHCNALANALVIRTPGTKEPHWDDSAEAWIAAMLATTVHYGQPGTRSLQTVRDMLSRPGNIDMAIQLMCESDAWDGMLARKGGQLAHFVDRERASTLSTALRHTRFLDTSAIAASTRTSSFDPGDLRHGKMTIYLILPPEHIRTQSPLLRLWIGSGLHAVVRGGLTRKDRVHFVLDEAASLGHLEVLEDAVDKFRGYGVRLQFYFQSLGQLQKTFPQGQDQTLLSNTTQIYFGVNDTATAELVSARLGEHTIVVDSGGTSRGDATQHTLGSSPQHSSSSNRSDNWQYQARKLLKPEEVIALPPDVAITFQPGVPPLCTWLIRYYQEPWLTRLPSRSVEWSEACRTLMAALLVFALSGAMAFGITSLLDRLPRGF